MSVYFKRFLYFALIIFCVISCKVLGVFDNAARGYSGNIEIIGNESMSFRFILKINENKEINVKLFENFGIKITEFVIKRDSIVVENIIMTEYRSYIEGFFFKYNKSLYINNLVSDIFDFKIFDNKSLPVGYIKKKDDEASDEKIRVFNMENRYVISVSKSEEYRKRENVINIERDGKKCCVICFTEQ
jgi:hypothetical protein